MRLSAAAAAALAACASPGLPPGGPPDTEAPALMAVAPDSGRVNVTPRSVIFRFDEVVNERPTGVTGLADLLVVSPQEGVPDVDWDREEIAVRPRRGWRPNTVYTVRLLPGMTDLRGNVSRVGRVIVFSTGATIPATKISGRVFDWIAAAPAPNARVEAITPDSIVYVTVADSVGAFTLPHLPPGAYNARGIIDENRNRALDPPEKWDTVAVTLVDSVRLELLAFVRDSAPPRISDITIADSIALRVRFDPTLDPDQNFAISSFAVIGPDSAQVPLTAVAPAPADTGGIRPSRRPVPPRVIVLTLASALRPEASYVVRATGLRGLTGASATSERVVRVPAPPRTRPDTAAAAAPAARPPR